MAANISAPATEVRRCHKCGVAAVVLISDWKHTFHGTQTGQSTREYRCQSCGATYVIRSRMQTSMALVFATLMSLAVIGVPWLIIAWRRHTVDKRIPIVPNASAPEMRYLSGPPQRACGACHSAASVKKITRTKINGIPAGAETIYACPACKREFTIDSVGGIIGGVLSGAVCGAIAWAFFTYSTSHGWRYGGAGVSAFLALALMANAVKQVQARKHHAVVDGRLPAVA